MSISSYPGRVTTIRSHIVNSLCHSCHVVISATNRRQSRKTIRCRTVLHTLNCLDSVRQFRRIKLNGRDTAIADPLQSPTPALQSDETQTLCLHFACAAARTPEQKSLHQVQRALVRGAQLRRVRCAPDRTCHRKSRRAAMPSCKFARSRNSIRCITGAFRPRISSDGPQLARKRSLRWRSTSRANRLYQLAHTCAR